MSTHTATPTEYLTALRQGIVDTFSLEELRILTFDLSVNYDDLPGEGISAKTLALLEHLEERGRIPVLLTHLKQQRPHVAWDNYLPAEPEAQSPYKGLQYYDEADAPLFFGREQLTAELVDHLRQHRFLAVVGASGSGKSSLVRAGVIPAVRQGAIVADDDGRSSADWPIHVITPGDEPLKALAASLTRDSESVTATKTLLADLRADADSLDLFLYRQMAVEDNGRLLLVVDQFEELFTQCDDPEERRLFVENLVTAVTSGKQGRLGLILTLRADFYAFAVQYESLRPLLETRQKIVGAMAPDELRQAIEAPAARAGWAFQPGLVDTILQDVGREPGALPLLSHALQETWARRQGRELTLAGYQAAGGVRRAIAQTADAVYASLSPEQQAIARNIFLRLTELGEGTEDTRRRALLAELRPQGEPDAAVQNVLDLLARRRLVTLNEERPPGSDGQPGTEVSTYAEVAHEALIREWDTLRQWLDENREGLRLQRQVAAAAKEWQAVGEEASYLYRGARLAQALEWVAQPGAQLNELEQCFLTASQEAGAQEEAEREAQQQRELEQARRLAEAQTRRVTAVRRALAGILALLVLAIGAAIFGFVQSGIARDNLATATMAQGEAQQSLATAEAAQATTVAEGNARATQEANAPESATQAAIRAVEAQDAQATAEYNANLAQQQARIAQSRALAAAAQAASGKDDMRALLLAIEAGQRAETALAMNALNQQLSFMARPLLTLSHEGSVNSPQWNGDESHILSWSGDGTARVWDSASGELLLTLRHEGSVNSPQWNEDGSRILGWSYDGTARVWDAASGELLFTLAGDGRAVTVTQWNGDDSRILLGTEGGLLRVYYTRISELVELACNYATRNLNWQEWQLYLPGQPYRQTCPHLPAHWSVPVEQQ